MAVYTFEPLTPRHPMLSASSPFSTILVIDKAKTMASSTTHSQGAQQMTLPSLQTDAELLTELIHKLGIHESIVVKDLGTFEETEAHDTVSQPILALILAMPPSEWTSQPQENKGTRRVWGNEMLFLKHTSENNGGLNAILHAVVNGAVKQYIR